MYGLTPFGRKNNNLFTSNFDDLVDGFFYNNFTPTSSFKVDVEEKDDEYLVTAELPGINKNEIDLEMNNKYLMINVKKEEHIEETKKSYIHKEIHNYSQSRSIYLANANSDNINAKLDNGILSIKIPKTKKQDLANKINID